MDNLTNLNSPQTYKKYGCNHQVSKFDKSGGQTTLTALARCLLAYWWDDDVDGQDSRPTKTPFWLPGWCPHQTEVSLVVRPLIRR